MMDIPQQLQGLQVQQAETARIAAVKKAIESVPRRSEVKVDESGMKRVDSKPTPKATAPRPKDSLKIEVAEPVPQGEFKYIDGIHLDVFDYFNMNPFNKSTQIKDKVRFIHDWASKDSKDIRQTLSKIQSLEMRYGRSVEGDERIIRIYNAVKIKSLYGKS